MRAMLWLISTMLLAVGCTTEHNAVGERKVSIAYLGSLVHDEAVLLKDDISISVIVDSLSGMNYSAGQQMKNYHIYRKPPHMIMIPSTR